MKEQYHEIGVPFQFEEHEYVAVERNSPVGRACTGCSSQTDCKLCLYMSCQGWKRKDKKDVIFIKTEGETNV